MIRETAEVVARRLGELPAGTRLLIGFEMPVVAMAAVEAGADAENGDDDGDDGRRCRTRSSRPGTAADRSDRRDARRRCAGAASAVC